MTESPRPAMPDVTPEATPGQAARSFEDMLADPNEQFDGRSELLASIAEYAAAPPATAGTARAERPAPEPAARGGESREVRFRRERDEALKEASDLRRELDAAREEVAHASAALAGDNEGVRLWMLDCGALVDKHRRERDEWQAMATGLRVSLESAARDQHRYRATLEEIRDGDSKYGDYARKLAREALGGEVSDDA